MEINIKKLKQIEHRATPGPWEWDIRACDNSVKIVTTHSGKYFVMGCERWGMHGACVNFQVFEKYEGPVDGRQGRGMKRADVLSRSIPGKAHHVGWDDYIDHPDAIIMIEARNALPGLLSEIERLKAERDAAVHWIQEFTESIDQPCVACKHDTGDNFCNPICSGCGRMGAESCRWQWRGLGERRDGE